MKKKIIIFVALLLVVGGLTGCSLPGKKKPKEESNTVTPAAPVILSESNLEEIGHLSEVVFEEDKEALKVADFSEEKKGELARGLVKGKGWDEVTGKELTKLYQDHFGKDQTIEFQDIKCFMDHHNEEEQTLYYYDKEQDKYVYNEKHPGHGGGGVEHIGSLKTFDSLEIDGTIYKYNMKILFYGKSWCYDTGGCEYGSGYKTYKDATEEKNALLNINDSKYMVDYYGPPSLEKEKLMNDYKNQLDTYQFVFEKIEGKLIFKEYKKI